MKDNTKLFIEMCEHLFYDEEPSIYFNSLETEGLLDEAPFNILSRMTETEQSKKYHPEGNVWNHTMMVLDFAAKVKENSKNIKIFMWAALLHDIGKPDTTKNRNGKITSYDHEKLGAKLAQKFLSEFPVNVEFIKEVSAMVRWHMQILFVANSLNFADIKSMKEQTDVNEIALLGFCDRMGRLGSDRNTEEKNINEFLKKCGSSLTFANSVLH